MDCSFCTNEHAAFRDQMRSCSSCACLLLLPTIFFGALVLGILGMVYMPQSAEPFTVLFVIGLCGTILTLFYVSIITIGCCVRAEPILPLRKKGGGRT